MRRGTPVKTVARAPWPPSSTAGGQRPPASRRPARQPGRWRFPRFVKIAALLLTPFAILAALGAGLAYVKMLHSPISLEFLAASIERGISSELGGRGVRIDGAELGFAPNGGFEIRLRNLRAFEVDGDVIASAPMAAIELSGAALWSLRLVPARVDLIEPRLSAGYGEDGQLTLSFNQLDNDEERASAGSSPAGVAVEASPVATPGQAPGIALARALATASERAREGLGASPYLREIGLRDARITLDDSRRQTTWSIPRAAFAVDRGSTRTLVSGSVAVDSPRGPWSFTFVTNVSENVEAVSLEVSVHALVPSTLARDLPRLSVLETIDVPISGDVTFDLSAGGQIRGAKAAFDVGRGVVQLPMIDTSAQFAVDAGRFAFAYDEAAGRLTLHSSTLNWGGSRITLGGTLTRDGDTPDPIWTFDLAATDGQLTAEEFGPATLPLGTWAAKGKVFPGREAIELTSFVFAAGEGSVTLSGEFSSKAEGGDARLEGAISPMAAATAKVLWPRFISPGARTWVGRRVSEGTISGGQFRYVSGAYLPGSTGPDPSARARFEMTMDTAGVIARPIDGSAPLEVPRAAIRVVVVRVEIDMPRTAFVLGTGERVELHSGRFSADNIDGPSPKGEFVFRAEGPLAPVLKFLDGGPIAFGAETGLPTDRIEGTIDGEFKVTLPLGETASLTALKIEGKARITDGRAKQLIGSYDVQGATVAFDFTEQAIDARGEMLLNGVLAKINWQRIFDAPPDKQPPLRITTTLDNADRTLLGLDVNHLLLGEAPVEVTVTPGATDEPAVRLRADLTNAELLIEGIAWRKLAGRPAVVECDVVGRWGQGTELRNFKIEGEGISIAGNVTLDADSRLRDFHFPHFSLDVVTRLDVRGTLRPDTVLDVKVRGQAFDGRNFFRALFSAGKITEQELQPNRPRAGTDMDVEVDTILGFSEVALRGFKMKLAMRGGKLKTLDGRGTFEGGKPLAVLLKTEKGQPRKLLADAPDAGQAFRLTGFYPNVDGGRVRLEVNLDGRGPAEKTGILWIEDFRILGDPVVSEVLGSTGGGELGTPARVASKPRVTRQAYDFDQMRVPFSVGHGQFVIDDATLKGPVLGATLRGKVDYGTQRVSLGGTYIPLQGLNSIFKDFPLLGPIMTGPRGEGIFGITFAIQGPVAEPQVIVNPLSIVAPGILREIFQMTNPNPRVLPRAEKRSQPPAQTGARADKSLLSPRATGDANAAVRDGWSSETLQEKKRQ